MSEKIKLNGPRIRLFLAGCLCVILFMATTTPESDDNFCSEHDHGDLLVTNNSSTDIWFEWKGDAGGGVRGGGFVVWANSSKAEGGFGTGYYTYVLFEQTNIHHGPGNDEIKHTLKRTGSFAIIAQSSVEVIYP